MSSNTTFSPLSSVSSVDGRYHKYTQELQELVSEKALFRYRLQVEAKWLLFQLDHPKLSSKLPKPETIKNHSQIIGLLNDLANDHIPSQAFYQIKAIEKTTNHDVKAVEYYLHQTLSQLDTPESILALIHFACTSEDINNLAYALMLRDVRHLICRDLSKLSNYLTQLTEQYCQSPMLARTHGQPASPTTMGKELAVFVHRFNRQINQLSKQQIFGKWAGAVGNYNAHHFVYPELCWPDIAKDFVESFDNIQHNPMVTQIESHDAMSEFCDTLRRFSSMAIGLCQDIWGYITLDYFKQKINNQEIGSSTMPHKVNPINFENAEGHFGLVRTLASHFSEKLLISRWQRDLSDSSVLRSFGTMIGFHQIAIHNLIIGLNKLELNQEAMDLDLNHSWEVLAEAVQTLLRSRGVDDAYEQLKKITRGQPFSQQLYLDLVSHLDDLRDEDKQKLRNLTPRTYLGLAQYLAEETSARSSPSP
ncbi:MAG: adenylosuccinate lyase [Proteobacteria bacterium]|nr:adenylosuccinate lyase [Pseudomonadota bacterium]